MSKLTDDLKKWIKGYRSGKVWLNKLRSEETIRVYLPNFRAYSDATGGLNPDELLELKLEGQRLVGTEKEFQAEELHDSTIKEIKTTKSVKANISMATISFYKHNRRPLVDVFKFERPEAKKRRPTIEDIEAMASVATTRRDCALIWFLESTGFRDGTIPQLVWSDVQDTGDQAVPTRLVIESGRLKGKGLGKYRGSKQIAFLHHMANEKLASYVKEARRKGIQFTGSTPIFVSYVTNGDGKGTALSASRIRQVLTDNCIRAFDEPRFSPHDFRDTLSDALKKGKVIDIDRAVLTGHKIKGVEKHYQDPSNKDLLNAYKDALPYLVPLTEQKPNLQKNIAWADKELRSETQNLITNMKAEIALIQAKMFTETNPQRIERYKQILAELEDAQANLITQAKKTGH